MQPKITDEWIGRRFALESNLESPLYTGALEPPRGAAPRYSQRDGERSLKEVLDGLDTATRDFNRMIEDAASKAKQDRIESEHRAQRTIQRRKIRRVEMGQPDGGPIDLGARRIAAAEREARAYLAEAKDRAERLVRTILDEVENEAARIRLEAQATAEHRIRVADQTAMALVEDRRQHIAEVSGEICARAERLASQIEGAEKVRHQFLKLAAGLAETADRVAEELGPRKT